MADNTTLPIPTTSGDVIATDDIGGVKFQRVKMIIGADGVNSGDISASNPLPITGIIADGATSTGSMLLVGGQTAGGVAQAFETNASGHLNIADGGGSITVDGAFATETTLNSLNTKTPSLGQALMASSSPVVIASNQSNVPVLKATNVFAIITQNFTAAAQTMTVDVSDCSSITLHATTAGSTGHVGVFQASIDGTFFFTIRGTRTDSQTTDAATFGAVTASLAYAWKFNVAGLKFFRYNCTGHTTGTVTWNVQKSIQEYEPVIGFPTTQAVSGTVTANLGAATTRAGFIAGAGIWYDDSAVALAANATFTGTSRDLTVTATATAMANAATYAKELRVSAESDQSGTLWLEVSRDNTNWRRVKSVATAAVTGGGQYAEIIHRPSWRYARVGFTNGATLQTRFSIGSILMAV